MLNYGIIFFFEKKFSALFFEKIFFGGVTCTSSCTNSCTSIISCLYNILWKEDIPSFPLMSSNINLDHCDCKFWLHHLIILFYNDNFPVNEQSVRIYSEMRSMTPFSKSRSDCGSKFAHFSRRRRLHYTFRARSARM